MSEPTTPKPQGTVTLRNGISVPLETANYFTSALETVFEQAPRALPFLFSMSFNPNNFTENVPGDVVSTLTDFGFIGNDGVIDPMAMAVVQSGLKYLRGNRFELQDPIAANKATPPTRPEKHNYPEVS